MRQAPAGLGRPDRAGPARQLGRSRAPSTPCRRPSSRRCPTGADTCGPRRACSARPDRRRAAVVGSLRPGRRPVGRRHRLGRGDRHGARTASPPTRRPWPGSLDGRFDEGWIDAETREGKRGGAFCMAVTRRREPGAAQLRAHLRLGVDAGPRAGARLPQHDPGAIARRCSGTPRWRWPRPRRIFCETLLTQSVLAATADRGRRLGHARLRPAGRLPGGRRHPLAGSCSRPRCSIAAAHRDARRPTSCAS